MKDNLKKRVVVIPSQHYPGFGLTSNNLGTPVTYRITYWISKTISRNNILYWTSTINNNNNNKKY